MMTRVFVCRGSCGAGPVVRPLPKLDVCLQVKTQIEVPVLSPADVQPRHPQHGDVNRDITDHD